MVRSFLLLIFFKSHPLWAGKHLWGFESAEELAQGLQMQHEIPNVQASDAAIRVMEIKRELSNPVEEIKSLASKPTEEELVSDLVKSVTDERGACLSVLRNEIEEAELEDLSAAYVFERFKIQDNVGHEFKPDGPNWLEGYLSLLKHPEHWHLVGVTASGTLSHIIQSSRSSQKENPRPIELISHSLIETSEEALTYLQATIQVPEELERCIESSDFKFYLPMRRHLLVLFLREWWSLYKSSKKQPGVPGLLDCAKRTYQDYIKSQIKDILTFVSDSKDESMMQLITRESFQLYQQFMSLSISSYQLDKESFTSFSLKDNQLSQKQILFHLQEAASQDILTGLLVPIDHKTSLGNLVNGFCDQHHEDYERTTASDHLNLLSCLVIQTLFANQRNPRFWSFVERQAEPMIDLRSDGFFSTTFLGKCRGVIVGERALVALLKKKAISHPGVSRRVERILNQLQVQSQSSEESQNKSPFVLPRVDRIVAALLQMKLHHLMEGYMIFPSKELGLHAIGILQVSNAEAPYDRYGLIISSTERQTSTGSPRLQENTFHPDRKRIYQSPSRVQKWASLRNLIAENYYSTLLSIISIEKEREDMWARCFRSEWNANFPAGAWMTCTTKDNQEVLFLREVYACSIFHEHYQVQEGITMRNHLNSFKHYLPVAILLQPQFPPDSNSCRAPKEGQHDQQTALRFYLDDLIRLHPDAKSLGPLLESPVSKELQ